MLEALDILDVEQIGKLLAQPVVMSTYAGVEEDFVEAAEHFIRGNGPINSAEFINGRTLSELMEEAKELRPEFDFDAVPDVSLTFVSTADEVPASLQLFIKNAGIMTFTTFLVNIDGGLMMFARGGLDWNSEGNGKLSLGDCSASDPDIQNAALMLAASSSIISQLGITYTLKVPV